jgi:hypothetical protein
MPRSKHYTEDHQFQWQSLSKGVTWLHPGTNPGTTQKAPIYSSLSKHAQTEHWMDAKPSETRPTGSSCRLITCSDLKQLGSTFEETRARYAVSKWTTPLRKIRVAPSQRLRQRFHCQASLWPTRRGVCAAAGGFHGLSIQSGLFLSCDQPIVSG